jgi:hypothetical protein
MPVLVRCRQCDRDVEGNLYDQRRGCCFDCAAARQSLCRFWQSQGLSISEHKPNRRWLVWESGDMEEE